MIKVLSIYDHGQSNIKLPKKEYRTLASQDKPDSNIYFYTGVESWFLGAFECNLFWLRIATLVNILEKTWNNLKNLVFYFIINQIFFLEPHITSI